MRTRDCAAAETRVGPVGGDEFAILLTDTTFESSAGAIKHLCDSLRLVIGYRRWGVTASVGVATFEEWPESVEAALDWADRLMYDAKRRGGDAVTHEFVKGSTSVSRRTINGCATGLLNLGENA